MARERVFKVIIDGEEYVSKAADEAGAGMDRFDSKKSRWISSFVDLKAAWDAISAAASRVWGAVQSSFDAFDAYEASLRKIEGTSKLTGIPLATLRDLADQVRQKLGLSSAVSNDLATELGKLAQKAGDVGAAGPGMEAFLDLGASRGLSAAETLKAVQQAVLGIDEGTDKLFGKNPSAIYEEFAQKVGVSASKLTDQQKAQALLNAAVDDGEKVAGSYQKRLESTAGKQELLTNRVENMRVEVGKALIPLREFAIELLGDVTDKGTGATSTLNGLAQAFADLGRSLKPIGGPLIWLADFMVTGFAMAFRYVQLDVQRAVLKMEERIYGFIAAVGDAVAKGGDLLRVFGINVVADAGERITQWARDLKDTAGNELLALGVKVHDFSRDAALAGERLFGHASGIIKMELGSVSEQVAKTLGPDTENAAARGGKAIRDHFGPTVQDLLGVTEQAMRDLATQATQTLEPKKANDFTGAMDVLRAKVDEARASLGQVTPVVEANTGRARDLSREVGTIARGALDLAGAFGVVDAEAQVVLTSVMNIATALPRALAGDLTSMAGILGGVANIARQIIGGDAERRRVLNANTAALQRLSRDIGGLKLNVTGEDFGKALSALQEVVPGFGKSALGTDLVSLMQALVSRGLSFTDLERIGKEMGIEISKGGQVNMGAVRQMLTALQTIAPGRLGQTFGDQLDFFRDQERLRGNAGTLGGLQGLVDFVRNVGGASALAGIDLTGPGARDALLGLLTRMQNGTGIPADQLGRLTGQQLREIIVEIVDGLNRLRDDAPSASPAAPPASGVDGTDVTPDAPPSPALTLAEVFRDYASESLPLLTRQIDLQLRIADATEATAVNTRLTAVNTRLTAEEIAALNAYFASGAFTSHVVGIVNRELAQARIREALAQGAGAQI